MKKFFFAALLFLVNAQAFKLDESQQIFFPEKLSDVFSSQSRFPFFWWNFIVVESSPNPLNTANAACDWLQQRREIQRAVCGDPLMTVQKSLEDWSHDVIYREPFPGPTEFRERSNEALAQIQLLAGQPQLLKILRNDPLMTWENYLKISTSQLSMRLQKKEGFLTDPASGRIVIPIQMNVAPSASAMADFMTELEKLPFIHFIGPHASTYFNEKRVRTDLEVVSLVGLLIIFVFLMFLAWKRRARALWLFPPVLIAVGSAAALTSWIYGSVHGLTLSFGSGIIGLALDYGLHGSFNSDSKQTWTSNTVGLLTTLAGLIVLAFSEVPLFQQMMVFSLLGLGFGFGIYYFLGRAFPSWFAMDHLEIQIWRFRGSSFVIFFVILSSLLAVKQINFQLDLKKFDYQSERQKEITTWFYSTFSPVWPMIRIHGGVDFAELQREWDFSETNKIRYEGLGKYFPPHDQQVENHKSWSSGCPQALSLFGTEEKKLFAPFFEKACGLSSSTHIGPDRLQSATYVSDLRFKESFLSIFFASKAEDEGFIKEHFPGTISLREALTQFSVSLKKDLLWMAPTALLLAILILLTYYRNPLIVLASLIPFFSGMGLVFSISVLASQEITLITVVGLIIVFGFSIDYGVFGSDIYVFPQGNNDGPAVWSTLTLAALTNILGFAPLLLAEHPVLRQLGFALFFGTIGTYLGAVWALPDVFGYCKKKGWIK